MPEALNHSGVIVEELRDSLFGAVPEAGNMTPEVVLVTLTMGLAQVEPVELAVACIDYELTIAGWPFGIVVERCWELSYSDPTGQSHHSVT